MKKRISIFASGGGSNAQVFFEHFRSNDTIEIVSVFTNNKSAGVIEKAKTFNIPVHVYNRTYWENAETPIKLLKDQQVNYIVLAGFMLLIPQQLIALYSNRMFNIHPALLPKYGGKGMYGMHVHRAVKAAGESQSGITIHLVNEEYDKGRVLYQEACELRPTDSPEEIATKVLKLEHANYAKVVESYIRKST